jgi:hypothetical protein
VLREREINDTASLLLEICMYGKNVYVYYFARWQEVYWSHVSSGTAMHRVNLDNTNIADQAVGKLSKVVHHIRPLIEAAIGLSVQYPRSLKPSVRS